MAAKAKEGVKLKVKSSSAPSTPQRAVAPHGRRSGAEAPDRDISLQDKPMPNYLKPTISSCGDIHRYLKKQQPSESPPAVSGKPLTTRKSIDKAPLPSSQAKERPPKPSSPLPRPTISSKLNSDKPPRTPKSGRTPQLSKSRSLPKGTSGATKKREANGITSTAPAPKAEQKEKVLSVDIGTVHLTVEPQTNTTQVTNSPPSKKEPKVDAGTSDDNEKKKEEMQYRGSEESLGGDEQTTKEGDAWKPRAPRGKVLLVDSSTEAEGRKLKFRQGREVSGGSEGGEGEIGGLKRHEARGKESPLTYNEVIEEKASKLAEKRNKVKALVGAFETVISLPQKGEEEVKGGEGSGGGQPVQQKGEEVAKGGESGGLGQQSQQEGELEEKKSGEGNGLGQQSQQEGELEEKKSGEGSGLGQQSQPQEGETEENDGGLVVSQQQEEESRNTTKESSETTEKDSNTKEELTESTEVINEIKQLRESTDEGGNATTELTESTEESSNVENKLTESMDESSKV